MAPAHQFGMQLEDISGKASLQPQARLSDMGTFLSVASRDGPDSGQGPLAPAKCVSSSCSPSSGLPVRGPLAVSLRGVSAQPL